MSDEIKTENEKCTINEVEGKETPIENQDRTKFIKPELLELENEPVVPINMTEETVSRVDDESKDIYVMNEDVNTPDFDTEKITTSIETCTYMELPLWKRKLEKMKSNLDILYGYIKSIPKLKDVMESVGDKQIDAETELEAINDISRRGLNLEMQLQSVITKYDVNMNFLSEQLTKIDMRMAAEKEKVEMAPTSEKTKMLIDMVNRNVESVDMNHPNAAKLCQYRDILMEMFANRDSVEWIYKGLNNGTSFPAIWRQYIQTLNAGVSVRDRIKSVFGFDSVPAIPGLETGVTLFFYYYLTYVSFVNESKRINLRTRQIKEYTICMFQNLGDCEFGIFDIGDGDTNEEKAQRYYAKVAEVARIIYEKATCNIKKNK